MYNDPFPFPASTDGFTSTVVKPIQGTHVWLDETALKRLHDALDKLPVVDGRPEWPYNDNDPVNKPSHYMLADGLEVRDVIEMLTDKFDHEYYSYQYVSDYVQMMQYLMRFMCKNGVEDLKKARFYLDKLIEDADA